MTKGFIHVYTGHGKGKTTASVGLAIRAKSRGLKVLFVQFMKGGADSGEISILKKISVETKKFNKIRSPLFDPGINRKELKKEVDKAILELREIMLSGRFDIIILDEFNCLLPGGLITESEMIDFIAHKPENLELILTGRGATKKLLSIADYVTEAKMIKHPFTQGIRARKGIEY